MNAKPIVNGLEQQYRDRVRVARVDLLTPAGRELAARYQFTFTPFFIGLNAQGAIVWKQIGSPPSATQFEQLAH